MIDQMTTPPQKLPPEALAIYTEFSDEQKAGFTAYFEKNKRSTGLMVALAILLPIQLFLLGKVVLGILFLLTGGGFGVWYVVEWFLTPGRVRDYNARIARDGMSLIGMGAAKGSDHHPDVEEE